MKHTTTMLDELCTATTAHGLQLHPTKTQIISNTASKRGRFNTLTVQRMNIEILRPEGETKHLGQLTTFKKTLYKSSWSTTSNVRGQHSRAPQQELKFPKYPLRDTLKLFDANLTPSQLYASRTWTMTEELKKTLQTTQRRMTRMIVQTERTTD